MSERHAGVHTVFCNALVTSRHCAFSRTKQGFKPSYAHRREGVARPDAGDAVSPDFIMASGSSTPAWNRLRTSARINTPIVRSTHRLRLERHFISVWTSAGFSMSMPLYEARSTGCGQLVALEERPWLDDRYYINALHVRPLTIRPTSDRAIGGGSLKQLHVPPWPNLPGAVGAPRWRTAVEVVEVALCARVERKRALKFYASIAGATQPNPSTCR